MYHTVIGLAEAWQDGASVEILPPDTAMTAPVARYVLPPLLSHDLPSVNARPASAPFVSGTVTFHQPSHAFSMRALPVVFGDVYTRQYARTLVHEDGALYHTVIGRLTGSSVTVTATDADLPPAVAVIVALPAFTPVTLPALSTVATAVSEDFHDTVLSVALPGLTVAASWAEAPFLTDSLPEDTPAPVIATEVTGTFVVQVTDASEDEEPSQRTVPPL